MLQFIHFVVLTPPLNLFLQYLIQYCHVQIIITSVLKFIISCSSFLSKSHSHILYHFLHQTIIQRIFLHQTILIHLIINIIVFHFHFILDTTVIVLILFNECPPDHCHLHDHLEHECSSDHCHLHDPLQHGCPRDHSVDECFRFALRDHSVSHKYSWNIVLQTNMRSNYIYINSQ